jgi:hypothetical protein
MEKGKGHTLLCTYSSSLDEDMGTKSMQYYEDQDLGSPLQHGIQANRNSF